VLKWLRDLRAAVVEAPAHWRLQRAQLRASRLERRGRLQEALGSATEALNRTRELGEAADYALPFVTVTYDRIATKLNQPLAPPELMSQSLRVCRDVTFKNPRLAPKLQSHIAWFEWRLAHTSGNQPATSVAGPGSPSGAPDPHGRE
jgi:hypothetical protein